MRDPVSADAKRARRRARPSRVGSTGARFPRLPDEPVQHDEPEEPQEPEVAAVEEPDEDALVGRTGARFGGGTRRARRDAERVAPEDAAVPARPEPPPRPSPDPEPDDAPTLRLPRVALAVEDTRTRVRPYVRTRGRTRTRADLAVETLVSVPRPGPLIEDPEHAAVDRVCDGPRSVAEVAARLEVPLGVARVVIDDMAAVGLVVVHPTSAPAGAPSREVMQRVLDGLHRL